MFSKAYSNPLLCALAALSMATAGCGRSAQTAAPAQDGKGGAPALLKVSFKLDWYPTAEHGGFFQALVKGYYRDAGLDVTILPGGPGVTPLPFVATGRAEFGLGRSDDVILAVRQGLPLVAVCAQMEHDPQAIMVHAEGPVKSFEDLNGCSVMSNPGANWVDYVQKRFKVKFNLIPMDYGLGRFIANKDFIQQCFISSEPFFVEQLGIKTRVLLIASGGYDPYRVVVTNRTFAQSHPEAVRAFVAATLRGYAEFLNGDGSEARARIQKENSSQSSPLMDYTIATLKRYKLVEGDPAKGERMGLLTPERARTMVKTLVDLKVLDAPVPIEDFVSFNFLPPATAGADR
jgi:NitT/TauT family transport system substrate-binding protein